MLWIKRGFSVFSVYDGMGAVEEEGEVMRFYRLMHRSQGFIHRVGSEVHGIEQGFSRFSTEAGLGYYDYLYISKGRYTTNLSHNGREI